MISHLAVTKSLVSAAMPGLFLSANIGDHFPTYLLQEAFKNILLYSSIDRPKSIKIIAGMNFTAEFPVLITCLWS